MKNLFKIDPMFKKIFNINLLYSNPSYVDRMMKKGKYRVSTKSLYKDLFFKTYILGSASMLLIYFLFFLPINFKRSPHMLDVSMGIFVVMNVFQTFTYFYNVFYESKDIESYMYLPIEESLVFKAKIAVVSIATMQLLSPMIAASFAFSFRWGYNILLAAIFAILDFIVLGALIVIINCIIMNLLIRSALISRFKNKIITGITVLTTFISVGFILWIQYYSREQALIAGHFGPISMFTKSILGHTILLAVTSIILFAIYKIFISRAANNFYDYVRMLSVHDSGAYNVSEKKSKKKEVKKVKASKKSSLMRDMIKYNMSIISDSTIISQTLVSILFPIMIIIPTLSSISKFSAGIIRENEVAIGISYALVMSIIGNCYSTCLPGIIYSADGENYEYIKSLPISEKRYFIIKTLFSTSVNIILGIIVYICGCIYFNLGITAMLIGSLIAILINLGIGSQWVRYDYENRVEGWQSTSEIYNRSNKILSFTVAFLIIMASMIYMLGMMAIMESGYGYSVILFSAIISAIVILVAYMRTINFLWNLD